MMVLYLSLHRIVVVGGARLPPGVELRHHVYVETLPLEESMRTPCYYNEAEMRLLKGTNLVGATKDRLRGWKEEWSALLERMDWAEKDALTW